MSKSKSISVRDLKLDLANFRTVPQPSEIDAVQAMISISPDRFWALMDSLIEDGYLPTENILVINAGKDHSDMIVKEGNRRIAALKLIHEYLPTEKITIPVNITRKIKSLSVEWKADNEVVPCTIYAAKDAPIVDKIVTLAHGKGEKAGRDQWEAVVRARHNRDVNKSSEPALDILEKYLKAGQNLTTQQTERWAGDFPITVLDEAIKKISTRFSASNSPDLAKKYPLIQYREILEEIIRDIGLKIIRFEQIRNKKVDFAASYGLPIVMPSSSPSPSPQGASSKTSNETSTAPSNCPSTGPSIGASSQPQGSTASSTQGGQGTSVAGKKTAAVAIDDPKAVARALKKFVPRGNNRDKVVVLRDEAKKLKLQDNPIAFCFILRSMFEISAKAYCDDHLASGGPSSTKPDGAEKSLVNLLREITGHLTNQKTDRVMVKTLHGALTELAKQDGVLSVTSMNQLVHNPKFSITASDICTLFGNIFPLLEAMN